MMVSTIFVFVIAVALVCLYMWVVSGSVYHAYGRELFNPLSYNLGIYVLTGLIGAVAIAIAPAGIQINELVDSWATESLRWIGLAAMVYGFVILAGFSLLCRHFFPQRQSKIGDKYQILKPITSRALTIIFVGLILFFTAPRLRFLMSLMTGGLDTWAVMALRSELVESELGDFFARRLLIEGLAWVYVLYLASCGKYRGQLWFLGVGMSIYFLGSLAKIKMVLFLISILMCKSWNRRLSLSQVVKISAVVFLGLVGIWAAFVRNLDPSYLFSVYGEGLVGRILISEISALYPHLEIFGNQHNQLGIASISNLIASSFDTTTMPRSGRIVLETASPAWVDAGIGGVFNTVFFGEAFANFGVVGLLISPFVVGLVYILMAQGARIFAYHLQVAVLVHAAMNTSVMAGFNDFIWNPFLIILFLVLLVASRTKKIFGYLVRPAP